MEIDRDILEDAIQKAVEKSLTPLVELLCLREKPFLTEQEAAVLTTYSVGTLQNKRADGKGFAYIKDGTKVIYESQEIKKYLAERKVFPKSK